MNCKFPEWRAPTPVGKPAALFLLFSLNALLSVGALEKGTAAEAPPMKTLAEEYAKLRAQKRAKAPGVFVSDLDGANGRLSKVMFELGKRLGTPAHTPAEVIQIMGEPDAVIHGNKEHDEYKESHDPQDKEVPANSTRLVYFFRGWASYLYFVCVDGKVQRASWYLALLR